MWNVEDRSTIFSIPNRRSFHVTDLFKRLLCLLLDHEWTCAAHEGIKPTKEHLAAGLAGFYDYATMYCKRCGYVSRLNF